MRANLIPSMLCGGLIAVVAMCAVILWAVPAEASCCAASQTAGPVRLSNGQSAAFGSGAKTQMHAGGGCPHHVAAPGEAVEQQWRQSIFGAMRLGESWQLGVATDVVVNRRRDGEYVEWGGGFGDVGLQGRYEVLATGASTRLPGIGIVAGASVPTGRAPLASESRLMSDVTGSGLWEASLGAQLEWMIGRGFVALEGAAFQGVGFREGQAERAPLRATARVNVGRPVDVPLFFDGALYLAGGAHLHQTGFDAETAERITTLTAQAGAYVTATSHLLAQVFWEVPYFSDSEQIGPGFGLTYRRVWW